MMRPRIWRLHGSQKYQDLLGKKQKSKDALKRAPNMCFVNALWPAEMPLVDVSG